MSRPKTRFSPAVTRFGVILLLLVIWETGARRFGNPLFICPPSRVIPALIGLLGDRDVLTAISHTCLEILGAFAISVIGGLAVGLAIGLHRFTRGAMYPVILLLYATPQVTILPLFVLIFGIGTVSKIAFGVTHGIFPVIMTVSAGVQNIEPLLLTSARAMGANRRQTLFSVVFPHLVPSFFTGLRLGMTAVLLGVLVAELYVSQAGVGHFTSVFTQTFQPQKLFALVAVLAAIAVTLNELCRRAEARFSRWRS
jgi:ABC-type nitrate/sulfonate/bicarbonate transport system permease component